MRSMSVRDLESTPGQLYCRRPDPAMTSTRNGRWEVGSLPLSSLGFMVRIRGEKCGGHASVPALRVHSHAALPRRHDAVARLLPGVHATEQGPGVGEPLGLVLFRHTGGGAFARSGAVEDDLPGFGDRID